VQRGEWSDVNVLAWKVKSFVSLNRSHDYLLALTDHFGDLHLDEGISLVEKLVT